MFGLIGGVGERVEETGPARTAAAAIQRASHQPAVTVHVRDATDDFVGFVVFATGNPIPCASVGEAKHHDAGIGFQHLAAASGLVALANEIPLSHSCNSLSVGHQIASASEGLEARQSATQGFYTRLSGVNQTFPECM
jgi:hypothetical protein